MVSEITVVSSSREITTDVVKIPTDDLWAEFLKLQISDATKSTYAAAIADFCQFANPEFEIERFAEIVNSYSVAQPLKTASAPRAIRGFAQTASPISSFSGVPYFTCPGSCGLALGGRKVFIS